MGMGGDVLDRFEAATQELCAERSDPAALADAALRAVNLARVTWARVYEALLMSDGIDPAQVTRFKALLSRCGEALSVPGSGTDLSIYQDRINWYRSLLERYERDGIDAVKASILEAVDEHEQAASQ